MTPPKRPRFLVRLPYYCLVVALAAIYYGYVRVVARQSASLADNMSLSSILVGPVVQVISLGIKWLMLKTQRPKLAFTAIAIFHMLFGMLLWCLTTAVNRGPGAVGEQYLPSSSSSAIEEQGEHAPLMSDQHMDEEQDLDANKLRPRRRSRRRSSTASSSEDPEEVDRDYLEMRPSNSSDEEDEAGPHSLEAVYGQESGEKVQIIFPGSTGGSTVMAKSNGKARFCRKCNLPKPDRAHHCSTCGFCIEKMDHHCPWLGGCVGFKNYKPFILFLLYSWLLAGFVWATALWSLIQILDDDLESMGLAPVAWGFLVLFGFMFFVMLSGFLPYHLYLACNNRTTIENMERNGRLLSLPPRAEALLSAGTTDIREAGLPQAPKDGQRLLDEPAAPPQRFNALLPSTAGGTMSHSGGSSLPLPWQPSTTARSSALASLTRQKRRELERKAGKINIYDLGTSAKNLHQVFGAQPLWHWRSFAPIGYGMGNGHDFPVNRAKYERLRRLNDQLRNSPDMGV